MYAIKMNKLRFSWDDRKGRINQRKHRVSFEEAQTVFFDDNAIEFADPDHSQQEARFLLLGLSFRFRVLVVCYCYRQSQGLIRIISARRATKKERQLYLEANQ